MDCGCKGVLGWTECKGVLGWTMDLRGVFIWTVM